MSNSTKLAKTLALWKPAMKAFCFIFAFVVLMESCVVWHLFDSSARHLEANDPRMLQNRSEMVLYFSPLRITRGGSLSQGDIIEYLTELGYTESEADLPGSYTRSASSIEIRPQNRARYQKLRVNFSSGRITNIETGNRTVSSAELEPMPLQNVVDYVDPELDKRNLRTRRIVLSPGSVPQLIADAIVSAEDRSFFTNQGVDWFAVFTRPIRSGFKMGGSSISQQLIKNNIVEGSKDEFWNFGLGSVYPKLRILERKIAEIPMAVELNRKLTKDEILAAYLSMAYMGTPNKLGIDLNGFGAASLEYFGKHVHEVSDPSDPVSVAQAATLAGMVHNPTKHLLFVETGGQCDVAKNKCYDLKLRRSTILDGMREVYPDRYSDQVIQAAKNVPLEFVFSSRQRTNRPIQVESINFAKIAASSSVLPREIREMRTESGRVEVVTSLDPSLQKAAVESVAKAKTRLRNTVERARREQQAQNPQVFEAAKERCLTVNSSNPSRCDEMFQIQASIVAVDPTTGKILAMSTGTNPWDKRSPGSLVKPFFYLKAIESGEFKGEPFTAATRIDSANDKSLLSQYCTQDSNLGGSGTVTDHLAKSWNIGACLAAQSAGIPTEFVGDLTGSQPEKTLMASIGGTSGSEVTLLEMVRAYTIFPNNGRMATLSPYEAAFQSTIESSTPIELQSSTPIQKADPAATFITSEMLRSVITNGTGTTFRNQAGSINYHIGGKTGSGMIADLWWVHYTPKLVVGVWVGMPYNLPELRVSDGFSGGGTAAPIAAEFMRTAARLRPELLEGRFVRPARVTDMSVNIARGCVEEAGGPNMYFIDSRVPGRC